MTVAWSSAGQLPRKPATALWRSGAKMDNSCGPSKTPPVVAVTCVGVPTESYFFRRGSTNMQLWNADGTRGKPVHRQGDYVAWRPDGKQFAALTDTEIRIWDADTRERDILEYTAGLGIDRLECRWPMVALRSGVRRDCPPLETRRHTQGPPPSGRERSRRCIQKSLCWPRCIQTCGCGASGRLNNQPNREMSRRSQQQRQAQRTRPAKRAFPLVWSQDVVPPAPHLTPTLAWSPDGQWLAVETTDLSNVRLCDLSGRRGLSFRGLGDVQSLSWSPDSRQLAMGLWDERVAVCDAQTGQAVWIGVHLPGGETAVFSGAGQLLRGQDKMDVLDQHLAYVVEHPDGRMEVVKPSQFSAARPNWLAKPLRPSGPNRFPRCPTARST